MYGIDGRRDLTESTRDDLSGYAGARPVRIGNGAFDQRQNDVYGAVLDSILLHTRRSERLPRRLWPIVETQAECATAGLARARPGHLGGARRAAALRVVEADVLGRARPGRQARRRSAATRTLRGGLARDRGGDPRRHPRARRLARAACCASTTRPTRSTPRRCWRRSSASCPATTSACARPSRPIADELTENGFVLRYRTDETDDGLSGKEGTFLICSFWLVSALSIVGEQQRARDLMERLLRIASPLGLYAEEFDTATARHLGNFPQAFSHLALIEAAGADHPRREARGADVSAHDVAVRCAGEWGIGPERNNRIGGRHEGDHRRRRRRRRVVRGAPAPAGRAGRDRDGGARPVRLVRELRPAVPRRAA